MSHSTNDVPYDKRLAKKKKFSKAKNPFVPILHDSRIVDTGTEKEQYIRVRILGYVDLKDFQGSKPR